MIDMDTPSGRPRRAGLTGLLCLLLLTLLGAAPATQAAPGPAGPRTGAGAAAAAARWGDRRLDEATFLTAHNAFTNYEDSRWTSVNQSESVRAQLDNGVRGLSLDTHWYERSTWLCVISFGSDCYPSDVYLCHGGCKTFAGATYALPRQSFHGTMQTVVDFLAAHPQEAAGCPSCCSGRTSGACGSTAGRRSPTSSRRASACWSSPTAPTASTWASCTTGRGR
ncbi:hypothetical protein SUDANB120_05499 [Streptomyces sp. enrichment culture]|uniref:hypothetical protein n=1 Tax=Streptomyces sp. enrichment culture TaxID=1795815 RepID=UPI003F574619